MDNRSMDRQSGQKGNVLKVYVCIKGRGLSSGYKIEEITPNIETALDWIELQREYCDQLFEDLGFYPVIPRLPGMTPAGARMVRGFQSGADLYGVLEYELAL